MLELQHEFARLRAISSNRGTSHLGRQHVCTHHAMSAIPVFAGSQWCESSNSRQYAAHLCRAVKTLLAESCSPTEQARGMAILSLGWGMGSTLGPMLGGALTAPCDRWPSSSVCHDGSLLRER